MKELGYATMCIGKWHVGDQPEFLPTKQGFDHYFGIPYSNDMEVKSSVTGELVVPLLRDDKVVEFLTDDQQSQVVKRYTDEAIRFITENKGNPSCFTSHIPPSTHRSIRERISEGNPAMEEWVIGSKNLTGPPDVCSILCAN